jgi:hypothetical protein
MPQSAVDRVFQDLGTLSADVGPGRIGLDVNIVIAGPGTTEVNAIDDAVMTARSVLMAGAKNRIDVDLNLHPYYVGSRGAAWFPDHPRCPLPTTARAASSIAELARSLAPGSSIFVGWHDEGHDRDHKQRQIEFDRARTAFDGFNQTNDPAALHSLMRQRDPELISTDGRQVSRFAAFGLKSHQFAPR